MESSVEHPLDHVAVAVPSIASALPLFELLLGVSGSGTVAVPEQGVNVVFLGTGATRLELIEPTRPDSGVARFVEKHGPGLHHVAIRVPDVAAALAALAERGLPLIDREPRPGAHGGRIAFLHPRAAGGVLIELVEAPPVSDGS
jgi:methylmalonyl-CoA/ethylmalonyl-CoA epimerase